MERVLKHIIRYVILGLTSSHIIQEVQEVFLFWSPLRLTSRKNIKTSALKILFDRQCQMEMKREKKTSMGTKTALSP